MTEFKTKPNLLKRSIAGLIDYTLVYALIYSFLYSFGEQNSEGEYSVSGLLTFVPILFWFIIIILLEVTFGATLGNSIVGLKPKSLIKNNGELTFGQSVKRHSLDLIDMFPFGLIAIITIKNTDRNQRLGDIWAKTIVTEINPK